MALRTREVKSWRPSKAEPTIPWRKRHLRSERVRRRTENFEVRRVEPVQVTRVETYVPRVVGSFKVSVRPSTPAGGRGSDLRVGSNVDLRELMELAISAIRNSHLSFEEIRARGGPCPSTLSRWLEERETIKPHLASIVAALDAVDYEIDITFRPKRRA